MVSRPLRTSVVVAPRRIATILGYGAELDAVLSRIVLNPEVEPVILTWNAERRRYEHPSIEGLGPYLLGADGLDRIRALVRATAAVLWVGHGRVAPLASIGDLLRSSEALVIAGDGARPGAPPRRENKAARTTRRSSSCVLSRGS